MLTEDEPESFSGEDMSVEIISPPLHQITHSISAKQAMDTMDDGDMSPPSSPHCYDLNDQ